MSNHDNTVSSQPVPNDTRVKVGHLVTGLVFLGLAGSWALHQAGVIGDVGVGWLLPVVLVAAGMIGLLAMLAGTLRRNRPPAQAERPEPAVHDETTSEVGGSTETPVARETTDDTIVTQEEENR